MLRIYWRSFSRSCPHHEGLKDQGDIPKTCLLYPFLLRTNTSRVLLVLFYFTLLKHPRMSNAKVKWSLTRSRIIVKMQLKVRHWYPGVTSSSDVWLEQAFAWFTMNLELKCAADKLSGTFLTHHTFQCEWHQRNILRFSASGQVFIFSACLYLKCLTSELFPFDTSILKMSYSTRMTFRRENNSTVLCAVKSSFYNSDQCSPAAPNESTHRL